MTAQTHFSQTEHFSAAAVTLTVAVIAWYTGPSGVQGATNATIAAVVTLMSFVVGLIAIKRWNPSWYSPQ
ncbi:hypothetical protein ACFQJ7_00090 [Halovenus rubra]|uniref:Uncharacterized protein n=2 Tax=Halovenus rubra TaxID=869890 RepID=A0ACC7E0Y9_9EURY|nr:hypothetical protein [Halovenus rubra]